MAAVARDAATSRRKGDEGEAVRFHFVTVLMLCSHAAEAAISAFVASSRVLNIERQLIPEEARMAWAVCVVSSEAANAEDTTGVGTPGARRECVDYSEVLSEGDFAVFVEMRELQKRIADREGAFSATYVTTHSNIDVGFRLSGVQTLTGGSAPDQTAAAAVGPRRRRIRSRPPRENSSIGFADEPSRGFHLSAKGMAR